MIRRGPAPLIGCVAIDDFELIYHDAPDLD